MTGAEEGSRIFNHELKLRVVSGVILAALVLWVTWTGGLTFALLWAVAAFAIYHEYARICSESVPQGPKLAGYAAVFLVIASHITGQHGLTYFLISVAVVLLSGWEFYLRRSVWAGLGLAYAAMPLVAMSELRSDDAGGLLLILIIFACVWGADILAYFFGKGFGGPKLAPRISPKKTWSGFIGSLLGALLLTFLVIRFYDFDFTFVFAAMVLVLAILSQIGDLLESMLKRTFDVKDSGTLIPGHGGVLDRVDGLVFAAVTLWAVLKVMQLQHNSHISLSALFESAFLTL
ncbi:MAG: phosphatidate cytidylyltransferase [Pseudomonadota bacterium]